MTTAAAPTFRSICQLTGEQAQPPTAFFHALSEADEFCAEVAEVQALRIENAELRDSVDNLARLLQLAYLRIQELTSGAVANTAASERPRVRRPRGGRAGRTTTTTK